MNQVHLRAAAMSFEIVSWRLRRKTGDQSPQNLFEIGPRDRARMIEVDPLAPARRNARAVAIKIVECDARGFVWQRGVKFVRQPAFARAAAAGDRDEKGSRVE